MYLLIYRFKVNGFEESYWKVMKFCMI